MKFEDFDSPHSTAARPNDAEADHKAALATRFHLISNAVESALKGDLGAPLPLEGNDPLSALARNLHALFSRIDSTCKPQNQEELQRLGTANARLEYLIENTPAIIYSSVPSGDFKMNFVSANVTHVLGYDPGEMVKDPNFWFNHLHPDDIPAIFSSLATLFVDGQRIYEYRFRASDGRYLWMHDSLRLIRDADGNPVEVIGALTDITDRRTMEEALKKTGEEQKLLIEKLQQAQAQLLQSEKMASIGQLAAGVAHEINNPVGFVNSNMGSLRGYLETLFELIDNYDALLAGPSDKAAIQTEIARKKESADIAFLKEDVAELMKESMDGLKRVKDIVQSLKDFSHVGETEWQLVNLHDGIDSTLNIASNGFKYKATIDKQYGLLPPVKCLASQINQVFMNLIVNASHAIKENGVITISTGVEKDWVWIRVSDTGAGIEPGHLSRIFDPFFTTKPVGQGTGLGLSLSYNIVNKHGGRIAVESEVGKGTSFTVHLPVDPKVDD